MKRGVVRKNPCMASGTVTEKEDGSFDVTTTQPYSLSTTHDTNEQVSLGDGVH